MRDRKVDNFVVTFDVLLDVWHAAVADFTVFLLNILRSGLFLGNSSALNPLFIIK